MSFRPRPLAALLVVALAGACAHGMNRSPECGSGARWSGAGLIELPDGGGGLKLPDGGVVPTKLEGSLPRRQIAAEIQSHDGEMLACYKQLLRTAPEASGKVVLNFTIEGSGGTCDISASSDAIKVQSFYDCLVDTAAEYRFPKPRGGGVIRVRYPYVFRQALPDGGEVVPKETAAQPVPSR